MNPVISIQKFKPWREFNPEDPGVYTVSLELQYFRVLQLYCTRVVPAMYQPALGIAFLRVQVNMRMTFSAQENKVIQPEGAGFI